LESPTIHYRLTAESVEAKNRISRQTFASRVKQQAKSGGGHEKGAAAARDRPFRIQPVKPV